MRRRILIVDDDDLNRKIIGKILGEEYETEMATTGEACLEVITEFAPDLVLLDIMMPGLDGYEVCRRIKAAPHGERVQVILVSGKASIKERTAGFDAGADDYLVKPFGHGELLAKVRIQLRLQASLIDLANAHFQIQSHHAQLENLVQMRLTEIVETSHEAVFALAKLAESRDPVTGRHLDRVRSYCQILAEQLSKEGPYTEQIDDQFLKDMYLSSPLHDIGKVGIPDVVLLNPDRLSTHEFEVMQRHTTIGSDALEEAAGHTKDGGFLKMAAEIARYHHERFGGGGYPDGLTGLAIPLAARIVALADVYDELTSVRVYKDAFEPTVARSMIEAEEGKHFDPAVVEAFRARHDDFVKVLNEYNDSAMRQNACAAATSV